MSTKLSFSEIHRKLDSAKLVLAPFDPLSMGKRAFGQINVTIDDLQGQLHGIIKPVITPGGRIAYYHLPDGGYKITVTSSYYLDKQMVITFPDDLPDEGFEQVVDEECTYLNSKGIFQVPFRLLPSPAYIFPAGSTLLRIRVFVPGTPFDKPLEGAKVFAVHTDGGSEHRIFVARADANGQATVCCNRMTRDRILQMNGFTFDGPRAFTIEAVNPLSGEVAITGMEIREFWENPVEISLPG